MGDAVLSPCGRFRYRLARTWGPGERMAFVMLNPSTADATTDDPTIRKCIGFARRNGFDGIEVVNLFAFRATDPADLRRAGYQVGAYNDSHIIEAAHAAGAVVVAWGAQAGELERPGQVLAMLHAVGVEPLALRISAKGHPWHPLMLPYSCTPFAFTAQAIAEAMQQS